MLYTSCINMSKNTCYLISHYRCEHGIKETIYSRTYSLTYNVDLNVIQRGKGIITHY